MGRKLVVLAGCLGLLTVAGCSASSPSQQVVLVVESSYGEIGFGTSALAAAGNPAICLAWDRTSGSFGETDIVEHMVLTRALARIAAKRISVLGHVERVSVASLDQLRVAPQLAAGFGAGPAPKLACPTDY